MLLSSWESFTTKNVSPNNQAYIAKRKVFDLNLNELLLHYPSVISLDDEMNVVTLLIICLTEHVFKVLVYFQNI